MTYDGERADAQSLDQLEAIVRSVADELAGWRTRALKAEGDLKDAPPAAARTSAAGVVRPDPELRGRVTELESENKSLRMRVEAAKGRVGDLLARLTFLEEQGREPGGNGGGASGGAGGGAK